MGNCCGAPDPVQERAPLLEREPSQYSIDTPVASINHSDGMAAPNPSQAQSAPYPNSQPHYSASSSSSSSSSAAPAGGGKYPQNMKKAPRKMPQQERIMQPVAPSKFNSTSTMYINDTLNSPNVDELLKCLSKRILYHIGQGIMNPLDKDEEHFFEIFDERKHPIVKNANLDVLPNVADVYNFVHLIFETEKLSHECGILCLAYVERIMQTSNIRLLPENWRRIVLSALMVASKVWEDLAVWNVDFLSVFPSVDVQDLGRMEKKILSLLCFDVSLSAKQYAAYYFDLREMSTKDANFPLKPLDKNGQNRLEERTKMSDDWSKFVPKGQDGKFKRSQSADWEPPKSPHAVLN